MVGAAADVVAMVVPTVDAAAITATLAVAAMVATARAAAMADAAAMTAMVATAGPAIDDESLAPVPDVIERRRGQSPLAAISVGDRIRAGVNRSGKAL
jgi:hypothetical protein